MGWLRASPKGIAPGKGIPSHIKEKGRVKCVLSQECSSQFQHFPLSGWPIDLLLSKGKIKGSSAETGTGTNPRTGHRGQSHRPTTDITSHPWLLYIKSPPHCMDWSGVRSPSIFPGQLLPLMQTTYEMEAPLWSQDNWSQDNWDAWGDESKFGIVYPHPGRRGLKHASPSHFILLFICRWGYLWCTASCIYWRISIQLMSLHSTEIIWLMLFCYYMKNYIVTVFTIV